MSGRQSFIFAATTQELVSDELSRIYYLATIIIALIAMSVIGVFWSNLPTQVPLWFTYPWGEGRLAAKLYLFVIPVIMITITIVNIVIGKAMKSHSILLARTLAISSLLISTMLILALAGILQSII